VDEDLSAFLLKSKSQMLSLGNGKVLYTILNIATEWTASCWLKVSGSSIINGRSRGIRPWKSSEPHTLQMKQHTLYAWSTFFPRLKDKNSGWEGTMSPAECINQLDKWHMLLEKGAIQSNTNNYRIQFLVTSKNFELLPLGSYMYIVMQEVLYPYIPHLHVRQVCFNFIFYNHT